MPIGLTEDVRCQTKAFSASTYDRACGFDGFLHHVAKATRALDLTLAREHRRFDREQITTDFRPSQTVDLTDHRFLLSDAETKALHAQIRFDVRRVDHQGGCLSNLTATLRLGLCHQRVLHTLAANLADLTFQTTDTGFARVVANDVNDGFISNRQFVFLQTVRLELLRDQVTLGDVQLFIFRVARQMDHFHTVKQSARNVQRVTRCHEHHIRQVVINFQVMVLEGMVLFRIQHFQKCGSRVTAVIHTHLVNFVQQEERIANARLRDALDDLTRQRTDVRATVTADFGFVTNTTQSHAYELTARCASNRLTQARLTDARGTHQAKNRAL